MILLFFFLAPNLNLSHFLGDISELQLVVSHDAGREVSISPAEPITVFFKNILLLGLIMYIVTGLEITYQFLFTLVIGCG